MVEAIARLDAVIQDQRPTLLMIILALLVQGIGLAVYLIEAIPGCIGAVYGWARDAKG